MEQEQGETFNEQNNSKKHSLDDPLDNIGKEKKKIKKFSAKVFRKQLNSQQNRQTGIYEVN